MKPKGKFWILWVLLVGLVAGCLGGGGQTGGGWSHPQQLFQFQLGNVDDDGSSGWGQRPSHHKPNLLSSLLNGLSGIFGMNHGSGGGHGGRYSSSSGFGSSSSGGGGGQIQESVGGYVGNNNGGGSPNRYTGSFRVDGLDGYRAGVGDSNGGYSNESPLGPGGDGVGPLNYPALPPPRGQNNNNNGGGGSSFGSDGGNSQSPSAPKEDEPVVVKALLYNQGSSSGLSVPGGLIMEKPPKKVKVGWTQPNNNNALYYGGGNYNNNYRPGPPPGSYPPSYSSRPYRGPPPNHRPPLFSWVDVGPKLQSSYYKPPKGKNKKVPSHQEYYKTSHSEPRPSILKAQRGSLSSALLSLWAPQQSPPHHPHHDLIDPMSMSPSTQQQQGTFYSILPSAYYDGEGDEGRTPTHKRQIHKQRRHKKPKLNKGRENKPPALASRPDVPFPSLTTPQPTHSS